MADDSLRYREHLQSGLASPGWEGLFEELRQSKNLDEMCRAATKRGINAQAFRTWCETQLRNHPPITKHDAPDLAQIFHPLLVRIETAAASMNLKLVRPLALATSTSIDPTPYARPSSGDHTLFIGPGTGKFCNVWAKAITSMAEAIWGHLQPRPVTRAELARKLKKQPHSLVQAIQLVSYYSHTATFLGFDDRLDEGPKAASFRAYLLDAMETFVMGHEYSHFIAEEREPALADAANAQKLETYCDLHGILLSRQASHNPPNIVGFAAAGAIVFLRCFDLCDHAHRLKNRTPEKESGSHPSIALRISEIKNFVQATTGVQSQLVVMKTLEGFDSLCIALNCIVLEAFRAAANRKKS